VKFYTYLEHKYYYRSQSFQNWKRLFATEACTVIDCSYFWHQYLSVYLSWGFLYTTNERIASKNFSWPLYQRWYSFWWETAKPRYNRL